MEVPCPHPSWIPLMEAERAKPYWSALRERVISDRTNGEVYPPQGQVFAALQTPLDQIKCVIVGQDPYHGPGQAHGLAFSVTGGARIPPSLRSVLLELKDCMAPGSATWSFAPSGPTWFGDLTCWAQRGVLLLNSVLTVREGQPGSHRGIGWEQFTTAVLSAVANQDRPVVWCLWGADAKQIGERALLFRSGAPKMLVGVPARGVRRGNYHLVLTAGHPSPLNRSNPFRGCRHFSQANEWLRDVGVEPVDWRVGIVSYQFCDLCKDYHAGKKHFPRFLVWDDTVQGGEENAREFRTHNAEDAAEKWAEWDDLDSAEYQICYGAEITLAVRDETGTVTRWEVTGETVPKYTAREISSAGGVES